MMKKAFLIIFGLATLIALILAFQNISTTAQVGIFFSSGSRSLFFPMVLMFLLGLVSGVFLGFFFTAGKKKSDFGNGGF